MIIDDMTIHMITVIIMFEGHLAHPGEYYLHYYD